MNWQTFFDSPLAIWIPIIVLVTIIIVAFRKQIGDLIGRLTRGNVEAGKEGVTVNIDAVPEPAPVVPPQPTPAAPAQPPAAAPVEPAQPGGAVIRHAKSREGGALAEDQTGIGALIDDVEVKDDLIASVTAPPSKDPKA